MTSTSMLTCVGTARGRPDSTIMDPDAYGLQLQRICAYAWPYTIAYICINLNLNYNKQLRVAQLIDIWSRIDALTIGSEVEF